jgi:hypothetical protein
MSDEQITAAMVEAAIDELREVIDDNIAANHFDLLFDCVRAALAVAVAEEREACAKIADEESEAMLAQRNEIIERGTLGGRSVPNYMKRDFSRERRVLAEGYNSLAAAIRARGTKPT